MEKMFYNLATDLQMEERIEQDFPHLATVSTSRKEQIKQVFGFDDFLSFSTEELAQHLAAYPELIRDIYTLH